ncbi:hypothetical protein MGN01_30740 [Methylobacterium gnaphalii]|uniref:HlyD family secretion protein n=1 Tax=Methylobacterium gnaphalii TaxID=1010610 RepID=A0A512JMM8_9HYPH|nr:hypothetical protein MGN01_30740 [Methylobacterium gnaphalii]
MSQPTLLPATAHRHGRLVRVSSVGLASVLALLIGTSVLPPIIADQSDRAVVNAPVTLLTAPIAGDIAAIPVSAGESVEPGSLVARISNDRLDRSTAIQLAGRVSELRERALAAENKRRSNEAYLAALDQAIREQSAQLSQVLRAQVEELRAKIASAVASGEEKKVLMDRQTGMVARDVASPDMVKSTTQAYNAALQEKRAAEAKLSQKTVQLDGLAHGLYAGDELRNLADLSQKRLSITYDTQRLAIEEKELKAAMVDQQALLTREEQRLDKLAATEIKAATKGVVFSLNATGGRHVGAGDSLASVVDCERSFVVAIFSYRQGQNLQVGSPVTISGEPSGPRPGVVTEILPKTSDTVDATYAVPFPQTERRELYVLVKPKALAIPAADTGATKNAAKNLAEAACGVGRWVTVTREPGWVPSTSVVWHELQDGATGLVSRAASAAPGLVEGLVSHAQTAVASAAETLRQLAASSERKVAEPDANRASAVPPTRPAPATTAAIDPPKVPALVSSPAPVQATPSSPASVPVPAAETAPGRRIAAPPLPPMRPDALRGEAPDRALRPSVEASN